MRTQAANSAIVIWRALSVTEEKLTALEWRTVYAARTHIAALGIFAAIAIVGCPGSLEDPDRFQLSTTCAPGTNVETQIFMNNGSKSCVSTICHDTTEPAGGLDLESPDPASRMIGKKSQDPNCSSKLLIDPANPEASFLLEKVSQKKPTCGDQMPNVPSKLLLAEIDCIHTWVVTKAYGASDGGGGTAGVSSGGSSGSAGSSSTGGSGGSGGTGGVKDAGAG